MNIKALIGGILIAILILILGIGIGMLASGGKDGGPAQTQNTVVPDAIKLLNSKVVPSVVARGTVTKIDGMSVRLMHDGASQPITIKSDASISMLILDPKAPVNKPKYITQAATFGDIKVNDNLEVAIKVLSDGHVEGFNVVILPVIAAALAPTTK